MTEHLPHEEYVAAVYDALCDLGVTPMHYDVESPDGEQLDGEVTFSENVSPEEWPDGAFLGWDQRSGWSMVSTGQNRSIFDLGLDTYAMPQAVAARTRDRLKGSPDSPVYTGTDGWPHAHDEPWEGAEAVAQAVADWEQEV